MEYESKIQSIFQELVDNSMVGIFNSNIEGKFSFVNQAMCQMFDFENPQQMQAEDAIERWKDLDRRRQVLDILKRKGHVRNFETEAITRTGREIHVIFSATLHNDIISGMVMDISHLKQVENTLRKSEEKFKTLVTHTEEVIYMLDKQGIFLLSEGKGLEKLGLHPGELVGCSVFEKYKDYTQMLETIESAFKGETLSTVICLHDNYLKIWFTPNKNQAGKIVGLLGLAINITDQTLAEKQNQFYQKRLKNLALQMTLTEEQERHRISLGLHDHVGQELVFCRIQLDRLKNQVSDAKPIAVIEEISHSILKIIQDTKELVFELSSPLLHEVGLTSAISQWLKEQVANKYPVETELENRSLAEPRDREIRTLLFRSTQELLLNVIKHARAKRINVSITDHEQVFQITVEDDGIGFAAQENASLFPTDKFGLFSIQERMLDVGGLLVIESEPGNGCRATLSVAI